MPRVTQVLYSITKQVRSYEPVRVEVTVAPEELISANADGSGDVRTPESPEALLGYARSLCESAMLEALERSRRGLTGF